MDDMEVKADALDGAFDAVLAAEAVDELKASVAALKAQVDAQAVAASRLPLDGAKAADPARDAFVERYPVVEAEDMPDVGANSLSIAFGNFRAGYLVADRGETRILRDPFSNKPFVHFYATKRVGGAIIDSQAIKLMKFAAS